MSAVVLGTAGHVDHGKTALVRALTGVDTDRLPQERARGISIELGFAHLQLDDMAVSLIDVPGHERFVRHMVAGAGGIDAFLLCVAADDGVMPQTLEHLAVLRLLGVGQGVVAITKCDLADPDRATRQVRELLGDVEIVPVSAPASVGINELRGALARLARRAERRRAVGPARLFVDRSFTVHGAGTVVTGTLWGAPIGIGDRVVIHPSAVVGRVRQIQVHEHGAERVDGGRVALNLAGVGRDHVPRGSVVVRGDDEWTPSSVIDVALEWLDDEPGPLRSRRRLQVFHGTCEVGATCIVLEPDDIPPGGSGYVQLRLDGALVALAGDRLVLRSAERRTVAGGVVVDANAERHGRSAQVRERLDALARGEQPPVHPVAVPAHSPPRPPVAVVDDAVERICDHLTRAGLRPGTPGQLADELAMAEARVVAALGILRETGRAVHVADMWFAGEPLQQAVDVAVEALAAGPLGIGELRDLWNVGRKHALAIAAHMDRTGLTRRVGDTRVLRRSAIPAERS